MFPTITGLSRSGSTEGDITINTTAVVNGVSLTVSPKTNGGDENRLWHNSPILRMYSGTLTITVPNGYTITNLDIKQGKWNASNAANEGTLSSTSWTGLTSELIITIAGNTQFKSITVTFEPTNSSNSPRRVQTMENYTLIDENDNQLKTYTSKLGFTDVPDDLTKRYDVYGVLDYYNSDYQLLPMGIIDPDTGVITEVTELNTDNTIKSINYYDLQGRQSKAPINGLYIEIIKYNNGNIKVNKIIK